MVLEGNTLSISFMVKILCRSKCFIVSKINAALILFWSGRSLKGNCERQHNAKNTHTHKNHKNSVVCPPVNSLQNQQLS